LFAFAAVGPGPDRLPIGGGIMPFLNFGVEGSPVILQLTKMHANSSMQRETVAEDRAIPFSMQILGFLSFQPYSNLD
jgi:hypothetical protein